MIWDSEIKIFIKITRKSKLANILSELIKNVDKMTRHSYVGIIILLDEE